MPRLPTVSRAPPVNLTRFDGLTGGDAEFARELIELFLISGAAQIQEAAAALDAADRAQLARAAHKLKGTFANIHAETLRNLAAELELHALALDLPALHTLLAQLSQEFQRAREFLSAMPASQAGSHASSAA